jgi:hypothetical protein
MEGSSSTTQTSGLPLDSSLATPPRVLLTGSSRNTERAIEGVVAEVISAVEKRRYRSFLRRCPRD